MCLFLSVDRLSVNIGHCSQSTHVVLFVHDFMERRWLTYVHGFYLSKKTFSPHIKPVICKKRLSTCSTDLAFHGLNFCLDFIRLGFAPNDITVFTRFCPVVLEKNRPAEAGMSEKRHLNPVSNFVISTVILYCLSLSAVNLFKILLMEHQHQPLL